MASEGIQLKRIIIPPQLLAEEHAELRQMVEDGTLTAEGALAVMEVVPPAEAKPLTDKKEAEIALQTRRALDKELEDMQARKIPEADPTPPEQPKVKRVRTRISVFNAIRTMFSNSSDVTKVAKILILTTQIKEKRLSINEIYEMLLMESDDNIDLTPEKIEEIIRRLPGMLASKGIVINIKSAVTYRRNRGEMGFWITIQ
ncbi:MAG: hypothetical protein Q8P62_01720 [Candidatus Peregrinibacteria bacterium]|nr:hypothetical protein [Candidatus Peregrinibacteria bacterium]